jgi:hypothetical protein
LSEQANKSEDVKNNGKAAIKNKPKVISNPNDVASIVLMQIDRVNAMKDDLTTAIKALNDTTKQLVRAYGEHTKTINKLQEKINLLETTSRNKE